MPRTRVTTIVSLFLVSVACSPRAMAGPFDGKPKLLLHVSAVVAKNVCAQGVIDCQAAVTTGSLVSGGSGPFYNTYILAAKGNLPSGERYRAGADALVAVQSRPMRILQVNKFHWPKGGSERYYFDCVKGLAARGHEVSVFAAHDPRNVATPWSKYFAPCADYHGAGPVAALKLASEVIDNKPAAAALEGLLREFRPDVAHLHNIHHQLSPSILRVFEKAGIPVVQTLHDYKWVCPAYLFLSHGKVCEKCGPGNRFLPVVTHTCHHDSLPKSAVVWRESSESWKRGDPERVRRFLAPSRFLHDRVVAHGLPKDRVEVRPYFLDVASYRAAERPGGEHLLYAGRLSKEKGLGTLFHALGRRPGMKLRVAGSGPLESELRARARAENLDVVFLGHLEPGALHDEVRSARAVVVPSEWYENQPYAVLEAMALGVPVIASAIGGLVELVEPNRTGWLVPDRDIELFAWAMDEALRDADRAHVYGRSGRARIEADFAAEPALVSLEKLYAGLAG